MAHLSDWTRSLLDGKAFPTLATLNPDGSPQLTSMWVARRDDTIIFSTLAERRKPRNIATNPRVSVLVPDPANPYAYAAIRGTARVVPDTVEGGLINVLSRKYHGTDYTSDAPDAVRVIIEVTPTKVFEKH